MKFFLLKDYSEYDKHNSHIRIWNYARCGKCKESSTMSENTLDRWDGSPPLHSFSLRSFKRCQRIVTICPLEV